MARLQPARHQDYRGLRSEGVPSHEADRLDGRMFVKEIGHGSISHSVRRSGCSQGQRSTSRSLATSRCSAGAATWWPHLQSREAFSANGTRRVFIQRRADLNRPATAWAQANLPGQRQATRTRLWMRPMPSTLL